VTLELVLRVVEVLGLRVLRHPLELVPRRDTLDDLLIDGACEPYHVAAIQYLREASGNLGLRSFQAIYPDRNVYQVQGYFPSRSFL